MAGYIFLGTAAAFGVLCALWITLGWLFSRGTGGVTVCLCRPGGRELPLLRRYAWLRELGLLKTPLLLLDGGLSPEEQQLLRNQYPYAEFCNPAELPARVEWERNQIDGTGT